MYYHTLTFLDYISCIFLTLRLIFYVPGVTDFAGKLLIGMVDAKKILYLLLLIFPLLQVRGAESDSVLIRTFSAGSYKASTFNYTGLENKDGIVFFANENGVLEYDGSCWRLIQLLDFSAATSIALINEKLYVGGRNEFGYLERDSLGNYQYISLRHLLKLEEGDQLKDVWQIVSLGKDIYFASLEMILRYDGEVVHTILQKNSYIFKIDEQLYTSGLKQGLSRIKKDSVVLVNKDFKFANDAAFQHLKGLNGEDLVVTSDNGIFELNTQTYKTKKWATEANKLLSKNNLYHVSIWRDSLYSFSTYLGGLFVADKRGNVIEKYNKSNGLHGNSLRETLIDRRGNLWLTSDYGLHYLQKTNDHEQIAALPLETTIRYVTIAEQDMPVADGYRFLSTAPDYSGSVVFHFATPSYHSDELEYSYYLEGFENSWSAWKTDVKKEYTNLSGGNYKFHVKARYKQEKESLPASMALVIPIPWFKTNAAYFFGLLLTTAAVASTVHFRTKKLKLLNQRLANIINKRTKELVEQREQLRTTNNELRVRNTELDNFVYRSSHDLVAPLKSLKGLIYIAKGEKESDNRELYFRLMHTSIEKLEDFIKSIMEYSSNAKKDVAQVEINLNEILDSIVQDLKYYDKAERIELIRKVSPKAVFFSDPKRLKIIISNLITNSIKYHNYYQESLYIKVTTEPDNGYVRIDVADNGRGIEKEYLDRIFDMFFRATDSAHGSGLGLYIVKDTVEKLGGRISVTSEFGKGTTFSLLFPQQVQAVSVSFLNGAGQQHS